MTVAAGLLNVPDDVQAWDRWSFDLQQNLDDIGTAMRQQRNVVLPRLQISPVPLDDTDRWLERVSTAIGQITDELGIQAADVENVDLDDPAARQGWIFTVFQEINAARQALKI